MKNLSTIIVLLLAIVLTNCGGESAPSGPFVGKIDFTAGAMGMNTNGSVTIDANEKLITYRIDAIEQMMGLDIVTMIDMKNNIAYSISPSKKIYSKQDIPQDEVKREMPTKKDIEKMKEEFFSHLKSTGNKEEINGYSCEEYEITDKVEDLESAKVWVSKSLFDRLSPIWSDYSEIKESGLEDLIIGMPMKGEGKADGKTGTFAITKITEGKEALSDLNLEGFEELEEDDFMNKVMEGTSFGNMMDDIDMSEFESEMEDAMGDIDAEMEAAIDEAMEEIEDIEF